MGGHFENPRGLGRGGEGGTNLRKGRRREAVRGGLGRTRESWGGHPSQVPLNLSCTWRRVVIKSRTAALA